MPHLCRHCGTPLEHEVIDLGHQPPSNAYLTLEQLALPEVTYPLRVFVCTSCWLVQLPAHAAADELFTPDYAYFSSTSSSWCAHAARFVDAAVERLALSCQPSEGLPNRFLVPSRAYSRKEERDPVHGLRHLKSAVCHQIFLHRCMQCT